MRLSDLSINAQLNAPIIAIELRFVAGCSLVAGTTESDCISGVTSFTFFLLSF